MKKYLSLICFLVVLFSFNMHVLAAFNGNSGQTGVLKAFSDGAIPKEHQALSMTVDSIPSNSPLQAFCIGWNFTFSNPNVSPVPVSVYVPLSSVNTSGGSRTYTFPLTTGWTREFTGIAGGKSIRDLVKNKKNYDKIIKAGCTVHANAKILKFKYTNGKPVPMGTYSNGINTPSNVFADSKNDIEYMDNNGVMHGNFMEFSDTFKANTKNDYYDLRLTLSAEPLPPPKVTINLPEDGCTVVQGTSVSFKGSGTGCDHIGGFVDGKFYGVEQYNPNDDLNVPMNYETTVLLDQVKDYTFQIKGRNTELETDEDSILAESEIHTVHVVAPNPPPATPPVIEPVQNKGNIYVKCLEYNTNKILLSSTIPNIPYDVTRNISSPLVNGYSVKGSYSEYVVTPLSSTLQSLMQSRIMTQSVTLSNINPNAYIYFWYDEVKEPVALIDAPEKVQAGKEFTVSGLRSYCKQAGAIITNYSWSTGLKEVTGTECFENPGIYTLKLTVTDSNGLTGSTTHEMEVTPPVPTANLNISGKIKENRRITISSELSSTPDRYPIMWDEVTWYIEPDTGTGATWDFGVKLCDGTVTKMTSDTDQTFLTGQSKFHFQARNSGSYKVKLSVTNTYPAKDIIVGTITVAKDKPPVVVLEAPTVNLREHDNPLDNAKRKFGKTIIQDKSYSPDGDIIGKRSWCYRYNSNNNVDSNGNNIFSDENTQYMYTSNLSNPFLPEEGTRLLVENDNDTVVELWWYDVGLYRIDLIAEEYIPDDETIKELLMPSDIRKTKVTGW